MHARPCKPWWSITSPHTQTWGRIKGRPILRPTAIRTSSSLKNKPQDGTGVANNQSPECGAQAPQKLARLMSVTYSASNESLMPHTTNRSHARCLCDTGSVSGVAEVAFDQNVKHQWKAVSRLSEMRGRMRFCSASVLALKNHILTAEVKKAEDAREYAVRTPSPPSHP